MPQRPTTRLRRLIGGDGIHVAPGAYDGLSARLVEESGSELLYASGGAIARSFGVPD
ncbi:isocitrate lyase, partial [Streptomyces sp. SID10362]|nr:isocitrate lyase [Streptomyces sp. SID10362]